MNDPRDSDNPFGLSDFLSWDQPKFNQHYKDETAERALGLMREVGAGFVRFDFLWEDIEPKKGSLVFSKYDRLVDAALRHGLKVLGCLAYNPEWSHQSWNAPPQLQQYSHYAAAVVLHFKDRVRHWQIWHEPDNPKYWDSPDRMEKYTALLRYVYPRLKAVDPTCLIHVGGLSHSLPLSLKELYEKNGRGHFDVVNIHPFVNPLLPDALGGLRYLNQTIQRVLKQYQDELRPVWFTEIGCPGMINPRSAPNWWLGKNPAETHQSDWVKKVYKEVLRLEGVEKVFWCCFRDTQNHFKSGSDYAGLIRNDFSKKPAYYAYREMADRHLSKINAEADSMLL